jgi:PH domain/leucine-rich repeat-containing protein phosphatase
MKLVVRPVPKNLRHVDVSHNLLSAVPDWLLGCHQLRTLYANNNNITTLPDNFFQNEHGMLHTLQLACNRLTKIPSMPKRLLPLQELYLQCNQIEDLPENFFTACENLILLNVSSNNLLTLPIIQDGNKSQLERLYATNNLLTDRVLDTLIGLSNLRILHLSYNQLTTFPESCISNWKDLEELNLSGNRLQHLPDNLATLKHIRVLRVHSNQLQSTPVLAKTTSLRVLDLAHNQLDKINLVSLVPKKLQFLDLSYNMQLQVDAKQLQTCRSQRPMSLVDVSGKNRASLPTTPSPYQENQDIEPPWKIGFSETTGNSNKLYIAQLRLPSFCNSEGLFGIFDGESNNALSNMLVKAIPKILLEERTVKETVNDYMKYTLLSAHRELKQQGQKSGVCATLCHISRTRITNDNTAYNPYNNNGRRFILRVASVGEASAVLIRQAGSSRLTAGNSKTKIGCSSNYPLAIPDPELSEILLGDTDEYLVLANKKLWEVMTPDAVAQEIRKEENVLLAAKRLQDVAQSYGAEENLSVILVKFNNLGTDIDFLMRELRHTIKKKPVGTSVISGFCKCGCCCETNNSCCHSGASAQFIRHPSSRSDRSSPSGQSDQASLSDNQNHLTKIRSPDNSTISSTASKSVSSNDKKNLRNGMVRAVRARIEEEKERDTAESDSVMSEEQFKCWEYMLEQNTQLLFDKELNTISKAFTKRNQSNLARKHVRSLSTSSPALTHTDPNNFTHFQASLLNQQGQNGGPIHIPPGLEMQPPFLSKHFGSARSFHPTAQSIFKPIRVNTALQHPRHQPIPGGPNAAYFGSLQRLMPYNLEYDFAMIQERPLEPLEEVEVLEPDNNRMQQYWGVATTEL